MPEMPRGMWVLIGALAAFAVVVLGVLAWAQLSGEAGSQRGLVIHSDLTRPILVELEQGQSARLGDGIREHTFVVKRSQFPATFRVLDPADQDNVLFEKRFEYDDLVDAEFRLSIDAQGFHHTEDYREEDLGRTPLATPA